MATNVFDWIEQELSPRLCPSTEFIYDLMESQSGRSLPVIYQPFDPSRKSHWHDRGGILDFLCAVGNGRLLDFGPGDGWPSLPLAPLVDSVVGVDASRRRVEVCRENARRLGIDNATFDYVPVDATLPFDDASFDGITAATSIEQSPDPEYVIGELYRVLRPGGRLRMSYEALTDYIGGREQEAEVWSMSDDSCMLLLYDRDVDWEKVRQVGLVFSLPASEVKSALWHGREDTPIEELEITGLKQLRWSIEDIRQCRLRLPSTPAWMALLKVSGFSEVRLTEYGSRAAAEHFDRLAESERPNDLAGVDAMLMPVVKAAVQTLRAREDVPMITAVK